MEKVLVVPTALLEEHLQDKSFIIENIPEVLDVIKSNHLYVSREYAEYAPEYKQIIPYAILVSEAGYYLTKRLKKQTEKRLHGLCSIGLGGHINPEEVGLEDFAVSDCAGIINDHSADVSNYHIGLVYPLVINQNVQVRETSKMTGKWATEEMINAAVEDLESWSKIAWENRNLWKIL